VWCCGADADDANRRYQRDDEPDAGRLRCGAAAEQIERLKAGNAVKRNGDSVTCLAFSPTHPWLASGGGETAVALMRTDTHQSVGQLTDAKGSVMAVDVSPTDQLLLSALWDHTGRVYRPAGSNLVLAYNYKDHSDCVYDARFLSNDRFVSCSRDQQRNSAGFADTGARLMQSHRTHFNGIGCNPCPPLQRDSQGPWWQIMDSCHPISLSDSLLPVSPRRAI
jgi:hypothetical protein